jgi:hypothetical protein
MMMNILLEEETNANRMMNVEESCGLSCFAQSPNLGERLEITEF